MNKFDIIKKICILYLKCLKLKIKFLLQKHSPSKHFDNLIKIGVIQGCIIELKNELKKR